MSSGVEQWASRPSQKMRGMQPRARQEALQSPSQAGFTLLEVLIALAILTVSMLILVSAQGSAARMSAQADRILVGSMLARQKLAEVILTIEKDGFSEQDEVIEDGDFDEAFPGAYPEFKWIATVKKVEVENISQVLDTASAAGADPTGAGEDAAGQAMDNSMMQTMMETASQSLSERIRQVTVRVEWPEGEVNDDVTLTDYVTR